MCSRPVREGELVDDHCVGESCHSRRMTEATVDVINAVEQACLVGADAALREGGFVPEPQVHMFIDDWDQPYVGWVRTRPYYRGPDAMRAIARLADAPAAIMATRVVLVWEAADLRVSLDGRGDYPNGMAVVVASLDGHHVLRWHPLVLHVGPLGESGLPTVRPEWGAPSAIENEVLPPVMEAVLTTWRALQGDPGTVFGALIAEGFGVTLAQR